MTTREQAMQWFGEKDAYNKSELSHKYFKESVSYNFSALTGREIEDGARNDYKLSDLSSLLDRINIVEILEYNQNN